MADTYADDYIEIYIFTVMNMVKVLPDVQNYESWGFTCFSKVSKIFKHASLDLNVDIVVVRVVILENDDVGLFCRC